MILVLLRETDWRCAVAAALLLANKKDEEFDIFSVKEGLAESYLSHCLADCHDYTAIILMGVENTPQMMALLDESGFDREEVICLPLTSIPRMGEDAEQEHAPNKDAIHAIKSEMEEYGFKINKGMVKKLLSLQPFTSLSKSYKWSYADLLDTANVIYENTGDATLFYHLIEHLAAGMQASDAYAAEERFMRFENYLDCYGSTLIEEASRHLPFDSTSVRNREHLKMLAADILDKLWDSDTNTWKSSIRKYTHPFLPDEMKNQDFKFTDGWTPDEYEYSRCRIMGFSYDMEKLRQKIDRMQGHPSSFIFGASGTGKENVAKQLHYCQHGRFGNFHVFNCSNVNEAIMKDELFGHIKGAFTGAIADRDGLLRQANGGTLFLDEIQDMPMQIQGLLLRFLNDGELQRQGSDKIERASVRIIAASNKDIKEFGNMVAEGKFRADLFFRLAQVIFMIPSLCGHPEDIKVIAKSYWSNHNVDEGKKTLSDLDEEDFDALMEYDYPGNVRELFNLLQRAIAIGKKDFAGIIREQQELTADFPRYGTEKVWESSMQSYAFNVNTLPDTLSVEEVVHKYSVKVFKAYKGNKTRTARALGISPNTLERYLKYEKKRE